MQDVVPAPALLAPEQQTALPWRQAVQCAIAGCTASFADQHLLDRLSRPGSFALVRHGSGGLICAAGQAELGDARELLAGIYGPSIRFGEPHRLVPQEADDQSRSRSP